MTCIVDPVDERITSLYIPYVHNIHFLSSGKGLTLTSTVIQGSYADKYAEAQAAQQTVTKCLQEQKTKGFAEVLVAEDVTAGINHLWVLKMKKDNNILWASKNPGC